MNVHKPTYHCFFEQSGTFKNEFKKLGFKSFDYDILNEYGETDYVVDLYGEIDKAYLGLKSIFDKIYSDQDMIIAFFPCTLFEQQILLHFKGQAIQFAKYEDIKKLKLDLKLQEDLNRNYTAITKLAIVCLERKIPLIIENPYSEHHYLKRYWCLEPSIIDTNRRNRGDNYVKATQFFFINCKPKYNKIYEKVKKQEKKSVTKSKKYERSDINPIYANRFIKEFIIDYEE